VEHLTRKVEHRQLIFDREIKPVKHQVRDVQKNIELINRNQDPIQVKTAPNINPHLKLIVSKNH